MSVLLKIVVGIAIFYLDVKATDKDHNLIKLALLVVDAIL